MNRQMRRQAQRSQGSKQAQQPLDMLQQIQAELENATFEGSAGGGVVKVVMTGKQSVQSVEISPEVLEDVEMLQELVMAAVNDAMSRIQEMTSQKLGTVTGGLNIPGLT